MVITEDLVKEWVVAMMVNGEWGEELGRMGMRLRNKGVDWLGHGVSLHLLFTF